MGNSPIRSCGTRWVTQKRKALHRVMDLYGAYIAHLTCLVQNKSTKAKGSAQLKGHLRQWRQPQMLVGSAMYIDVLKLKPISLLSLAVKCDHIDIVTSIRNTLKAVKDLNSLLQQHPRAWPSVQVMQGMITDVTGQQEYQGIVL